MRFAIQLPPRADQQEFNLRVWRRMLDDPELAKIEVWLCETDGTMRFHRPAGPIERSALCPDFPASIPG